MLVDSVSTQYGDIDIPQGEGQAAPIEGQAPPVQSAEQQAQEPWWKQHLNSEMEFQAAGKQVKAPLSKVQQWAQQGYDYAQRMQAFNQQKAEVEAKAQELAKDGEWAEVVKFARENPEWAQYTRQQFEQRQQWRQENADNPIVREFEAFKQELTPLKQEAEALKAERVRIQQEQEDRALDVEIQSVSDRYSKIGMDLDQIDPESGMSYKLSAMKYGSENGIQGKNAFKIAFQALYGDRVEGLMQEAAKKQAAEEFAKRQKEGFIGRTSTPTQAPSKAQNVRNRSWGSLSDEALRDVQAGKY